MGIFIVDEIILQNYIKLQYEDSKIEHFFKFENGILKPLLFAQKFL